MLIIAMLNACFGVLFFKNIFVLFFSLYHCMNIVYYKNFININKLLIIIKLILNILIFVYKLYSICTFNNITIVKFAFGEINIIKILNFVLHRKLKGEKNMNSL